MSTARELTNHLARLLREEQGAMADFLLALAEFDRKKLWRELGHTSLFYYLHRELRLSKGAAQNRKTAAELIQAFPEVEVARRRSWNAASTSSSPSTRSARVSSRSLGRATEGPAATRSLPR